MNGWEVVLLVLIAVFVLGPDRLPEYAAKLAHSIRRLRVMAEGAKDQLKDQLGPEYQDINWRQYDPRQYDPRRIVKEALLDPLDEAVAPLRGEIDSVRSAASGRSGAASGAVAGTAAAGAAALPAGTAAAPAEAVGGYGAAAAALSFDAPRAAAGSYDPDRPTPFDPDAT